MSDIIILPSLKEIRDILGTESIGYSKESLQAERSRHLVDEALKRDRSIDDRFDAALALRERNLLTEGRAGELITERLFALVDKTTAASREDGNPTYSIEDKRTGIIASIALQGTVLNSPLYLSRLVRWIHSGVEAMINLHERENRESQLSLLENYPSELSASHQKNKGGAARTYSLERRINRAYRAVALIAGTYEDAKVADVILQTLCPILCDRRVETDFKIFAITAITTIDSPLSFTTGLLLATDRRPDIDLTTHILNTWKIFLPDQERARSVLSELCEGCDGLILKAKLEGDLSYEETITDFQSRLQACLSPKYSATEVQQARYELGSKNWRIIAHLKRFESILAPSAQGIGMEILPKGHSGIFSFETIRFSDND